MSKISTEDKEIYEDLYPFLKKERKEKEKLNKKIDNKKKQGKKKKVSSKKKVKKDKNEEKEYEKELKNIKKDFTEVSKFKKPKYIWEAFLLGIGLPIGLVQLYQTTPRLRALAERLYQRRPMIERIARGEIKQDDIKDLDLEPQIKEDLIEQVRTRPFDSFKEYVLDPLISAYDLFQIDDVRTKRDLKLLKNRYDRLRYMGVAYVSKRKNTGQITEEFKADITRIFERIDWYYNVLNNDERRKEEAKIENARYNEIRARRKQSETEIKSVSDAVKHYEKSSYYELLNVDPKSHNFRNELETNYRLYNNLIGEVIRDQRLPPADRNILLNFARRLDEGYRVLSNQRLRDDYNDDLEKEKFLLPEEKKTFYDRVGDILGFLPKTFKFLKYGKTGAQFIYNLYNFLYPENFLLPQTRQLLLEPPLPRYNEGPLIEEVFEGVADRANPIIVEASGLLPLKQLKNTLDKLHSKLKKKKYKKLPYKPVL